jgi:hypothetical protein
MPIVTLIRPMRLHHGDGLVVEYGCGQYRFPYMPRDEWYILAHTATGRPELDSTPLTDPGPPVVITTTHPWMPAL